MKRGKWILLVALLLLVVTAGAGYYLYHRWALKPGFNTAQEEGVLIYIYPEATWTAVVDSIEAKVDAPHAGDLRWLFEHRAKEIKPKVGAYGIEPDVTTRQLYNQLTSGMQTPVMVHVRSTRLPGMIWRSVGNQLLIDSATIAEAMTDKVLLEEVGVQDTTLAYHILPNSYQFYWDVTAEDLVRRLARESEKFWNSERLSQAEAIGLSPIEVVNLAAIVQEESAKTDEYAMIAGLYLNRLRMGMPLQADPTIKFALQDFGLRRILHHHLRVESPYNTYLNKGLPPGPIRIPSIAAIEGVLQAVDHDYIYMCAKADFSGYHAFASTYSQHLQNARAYTKALDERNIK